MVNNENKILNSYTLNKSFSNDLPDFSDDLFLDDFELEEDFEDIFNLDEKKEENSCTLKKFFYNKHILNIAVSACTDKFVATNILKIETNLFNKKDLINFLNINNIEYDETFNEINIKKQKNLELANNIELSYRNEVVTLVLKGYYNLIEYIYDFLVDTFKMEFILIEKMYIFEQIMNFVLNFDKDILKIYLYKLLPFSISTKLKNNKILLISDLELIDVNLFYTIELETILYALKTKITAKPNIIYEDVLSSLKKKEIEIINLRSSLTLEEVGKRFNCTRERIRQIEKKALTRLSKLFANVDLSESIRLFSDKYLIFSENDFLMNQTPVYLIEKIYDDSFYKSNLIDKTFFSGNDEREIIEFFLQNMPDVLSIDEKKTYIKDILLALSDIDKSYYFCYDELDNLLNSYYRYNYGLFYSKYKLAKTYIFPKIVRDYFKEGIDIYDELSLEEFKKISKEFFNYDISNSSYRALTAVLQKCLILKDRGFYFYQDNILLIDDNLKEKISKYIEKSKNTVISYKEIFEAFETELNACDIDNRYYLASQMKLLNIPNTNYSRDYIFKGNLSCVSDIYKEIEKYITKSSELVTKELMERKYPFVKYTTFQNLINNTSIINMNGYFTTIEKLNISKDEYALINNTLNQIIDNTKIFHAREVFRKSKKHLDYFYGRNGIDHYLKFYYLISKIFPNEFNYNRPYIASHEIKMMSGLQQLIERIVSNKKCSISGDVRMFAQEIGYYIDSYLDLIITNNDSIIFADQNNVITLKEAGIKDENFESIDSILKEFMSNSDYRPLSQFYLNWKLPKIGIPWNEWVLASIINKYSEKYYVTFSSKTLSEAYPVIVDNEVDEENIDFSKIKFNKSSDYDVEIDFDFL